MIESIVTASLLICVLVVLRRILRGSISPALQYGLWLLVAVRLLLPFSLVQSHLSIMNLASGASLQQVGLLPAASVPADDRADDIETAQPNQTDSLTSELVQTAQTDQPSSLSAASKTLSAAADGSTTASSAIRLTWAIGALATGFWFFLQNLLLAWRLRRDRALLSVPQSKLSTYLTSCFASPCLFGLLRPAIYLTPESLADQTTLNYILAHEQTHYRHLDHIWSLIRCICLSLYWFHPLVWLAAALSREDSELACDAGTLKLIGEQNNKTYGNMLLNMVVRRSNPFDLLCIATTMTSGKSGMKKRILMIANKPKMLLSSLLAITLIVTGTVACTFTGANSDTAVPLSDEELAYFNENSFFNGNTMNIHNQFLSSSYADTKNIDLFQLFYCGSGLAETVTDAELRAVIAAEGESWDINDLPCPCEKISRANMDAVLVANTGLQLSETAGVNLDHFVYLEQYDAYYFFHGDTNYRGTVTFYAGEQQGDLIRLYYEDQFFCDGDKVVTLQEQEDGSYHFVSNQVSYYTKTGSVSQPEGVLADTITASDTVLTAAKQYVQTQYNYWLDSTGAYQRIDNQIQMIGTPAVYDNWRIEGLTRVDWKADGYALPLEVYQLDYRIHTTTPDQVKTFLAGGMDLDEEGWLLPTYPHSTFLVFDIEQGADPVYLFALMENDCAPGDIRFASDLLFSYERGEFINSEGARATWMVYHFFDALSNGDFEAMKPFCIPACVKSYFHENDVFGLQWAQLVGFHYIGSNEDEYQLLADNEDAVFITVEMRAAPNSVHYNGTQEIQITSFYVILQYQDNGEYLIKRFVTGL